MPVINCLQHGVNIGGHHKIKMEDLRALCTGLKFSNIQTHRQSGNVIFRTDERNLPKLADKLQSCIEKKVGFRPDILFRTIAEIQEVVGRNPFAKRRGIEANKLAAVFLESEPPAAARQALLAMDIAAEEIQVVGRQLFIYFSNGQARPKISWSRVEKILGKILTGRNWNTVTKLLELAKHNWTRKICLSRNNFHIFGECVLANTAFSAHYRAENWQSPC